MMIYRFNSLLEAYSSTIKGLVGVDSQGAYIEIDDRSKEEILADKWKKIEEIREAKYSNGVKVGEYWFQTSLNAKIRYMGAAAMGSGFIATDGWKTMTGEKTPLTGSLAAQIMMAIAINDAAIFQAAEQHKEAMMSSEDPSVYDFSEGWPETFGEYQET